MAFDSETLQLHVLSTLDKLGFIGNTLEQFLQDDGAPLPSLLVISALNSLKSHDVLLCVGFSHSDD